MCLLERGGGDLRQLGGSRVYAQALRAMSQPPPLTCITISHDLIVLRGQMDIWLPSERHLWMVVFVAVTLVDMAVQMAVPGYNARLSRILRPYFLCYNQKYGALLGGGTGVCGGVWAMGDCETVVNQKGRRGWAVSSLPCGCVAAHLRLTTHVSSVAWCNTLW